MRALVVLKKELFPITFPKKSQDLEDVEEESRDQPDQEELLSTIDKLDKAKKELKRILDTKINRYKNKALSFDEFKRRQTFESSAASIPSERLPSKGKEKGDPPLSDEKQTEDLQIRYNKYLEQRQASRLTDDEYKKTTKNTKEALDTLPVDKVMDQEIPELINSIDDEKSELTAQLKSGVGYSMVYSDGNYPYWEIPCFNPSLTKSKVKNMTTSELLKGIRGKPLYRLIWSGCKIVKQMGNCNILLLRLTY